MYAPRAVVEHFTQVLEAARALSRMRHGIEARAAGERVFDGDFSDAAMADFMRLVMPAYFRHPSTAGCSPSQWLAAASPQTWQITPSGTERPTMMSAHI
jgi:hypothetical protein